MISPTGQLTGLINYMGTSVTIRVFPNKDGPTYDADTEAPTYGSSVNIQTRAIIRDPTKFEIENSAGKIIQGSKKFTLNASVAPANGTFSVGDNIRTNTGTYEISELKFLHGKTIAFANKLEDPN